jgi:hypothetical protein
MRATLTGAAVQSDFPWAGSRGEPGESFSAGETEDYPIHILPEVLAIGDGAVEMRVPWDFKDGNGVTVHAGYYLVKLQVGDEVITRPVIRLN